MKILLIHNYYRQKGGEDTYFNSLVKLLKDNGHKVITFTANSQEINNLKNKYKAVKSMFGFNCKTEHQLSLLIKKEKPEVAHFHNIFPLIGPVGYVVCKKYNIPIVQTVHNYRFLPGIEKSLGYHYQSFLYQQLIKTSVIYASKKKLFNLINHFIFPSMFSKNIFLKKSYFKIKSQSVIPHFSDIKIKKYEKKEDYFLFAGRFSKEKGIIPLLNIFRDLPQLNLIVIGEGPLENKVIRYKNFNNIKIYPWLSKDKLYSFIKKARAVIIPSLSFEVMPLTAIESLMLKTKVVIPDQGAFKEINKNNDDVEAYQFNNFSDLKNKLINLSKKTSSYINTNYSSLYSPKIHYQSLIKVYKKLIEQSKL